MKRVFVLFILIMLTLLLQVGTCPAQTRSVYILTAVGSINPGLAEFIVHRH